MQDPSSSQTNIDSVIHSDDLPTPPTDIAVTRVSNGNSNGEKGSGRVKAPASPSDGGTSNFRLNNAPGLTVERRFTRPGEDVYSTVEWELRDAVISNERGEKVFEQKNCEIPKSWTQLATNVVVSKYFRGHVGTPEREHSVRQLIGRVADTIANWGRKMDYFATEADAQTFQDELTHILLHQKAAFNSPVWFNVGLKDQPVPQASACQPYHARVLTTKGLIPIGQIVEQNQIGLQVFDGEGTTEVVAVKHNGRKPVYRIELMDGFIVEATADHLVCAHDERRVKTLDWRRVDELAVGMNMRVYSHAARTYVATTTSLEISEAALAGWLQADGFVGQYATGTNRSLTIEFLTNGEEEHKWVQDHLQVVFPQAHANIRDVKTQDTNMRLRRIRLYGEHLRPFVEKYELLKRGINIRVPSAILTASEQAVIAYLGSVYQSEGYVSFNGTATHLGMAVISEKWAQDIQVLLTRLGIYARRTSKQEKRADRHNTHCLDIALLSERIKFAQCIGFISEAKSSKLIQSLAHKGKRCADIRYPVIKAIHPVGEMDVYDIQTCSGKYLSEGVLVHNCFINSVDDTMESILTLAKTEGMLFKFGSGTGTNLSSLRGSNEPLKGGGTASGPLSFMRGYDQFAAAIKCLTPDAYIHTERGMQTMGEVIDSTLEPGFHPNDSIVLATKDGPTRISHVYVSPKSDTYRLTLRHTNLTLRGTGEHPVLTLTPDFQLVWKCLTDLQSGDHVAVSRRAEMWPTESPAFTDFQHEPKWAKKSLSYPTQMTSELARLLGYMVSEGCMDDERFRFCNADEDVFNDFIECVRSVFGIDPVRNVSPRTHAKTGVTTWLFEACWTNAIRFLKHVGLTTARSDAKTIPWSIRCAPRAQVVEFLRAYFEGDGHISTHVYAASASKTLLSEVQLLLLNMGMVSLLRPHPVNGKDYWSLYLRGEQAWIFVREVGFVSVRKRNAAQFAGDKHTNLDSVPFLAEVLRTRAEGSYLRCTDGKNRRLAFGFFNRRAGTAISYNQLRNMPGLVEKVRQVNAGWGATLETILEREFFWDHVASVEAAEPAVTYDFTVPETHSFIANGIVNHNSGGKTRRAAKMVMLDVDHPDIEAFIVSKAEEEKKAHALIDAGYSGMFNVYGGAYDSVQFQNANHSVRVSDEFMETYLKNGDWITRNVLDKKPNKTYKAADLMKKIGESAWVCGDPGMQYDTTINTWHTCKNTDKIRASNPCSEYMFINDSACNLASLNLMKFRTPDGEFDVEPFQHACRILITAQEILVDNASYPTPRIQENSHDYRPLGLGYANLGALLMARGVPYDSDAGRAYAGAITAIMTGEAYHQSAAIARDHGWPFPGYAKNREPMLEVMRMHRQAVENIDSSLVPADMLQSARQSWDNAVSTGVDNGYRNAQATVLAPTGCLVGGSLILTSRGLVRLKSLGNPDGKPWQSLDVDISTDEGARRATQFYVNGAEPVVTIETKRGYRIQGTPLHRIKVVDNAGDWQWRRFADIRPDDRVPLMLGGLVGVPQRVPLPPLSEAYWTSDYTTFVPRQVTSELAEFVGYFMGDGSLHSKGIRLCVANEDQDVVTRLAHLGKTLFGLDAAIAIKQGYTEVAFHSVRLTLWWEACGFAKTAPHAEHTGKGYAPHIPDAILHSNDPSVYAAFIRGLFEADATCSNGYVAWMTTHAHFSHDVQSLLLTLGFVTTRKTDMPGTGSFGVNAKYILRLLNVSVTGRFGEEVGFLSERKCQLANASSHPQASRHDQIPLSREMVDLLAPVNDNLRKTLLLSLSRTGTISRRSAEELLARAANPKLGHLLGFFYDEVASASLGEEQFTYDISVPDNVTYVANGFVSHNTIGFLMDCDTTGIEPDIAIVKYKNLVGGGVMKIVNNTVPEALDRLGYTEPQVKAIIAYIDKNDTIEGAPELKPEHLPIFDCAFKPGNGTRSIHYMGHVRMMAAAQPFISGAISKTVNMPHEATAEDITGVYVEGWKLGLKAIAIYRDGSKRTQPLNTKKAEEASEGKGEKGKEEETIHNPEHLNTRTPEHPTPTTVIVNKPLRRKLPDERAAVTHKFSIAGHEGYITVGMYPDGTPGEIFLTMSKEGSTISGLMDSFATAISLALQYGVPLQTLVDKFAHARFEPSGITNNPDIRFAKSIMDYIFRWLGTKFLNRDPEMTQPTLSNGHNGHAEENLGAAEIASAPPKLTLTVSPTAQEQLTEQEHQTFQNQADAPICTECGSLMVRNGACYKCLNCGSVFGCS